MFVNVGQTRLWYDLEDSDAPTSARPTVVLLHGGPGSFDHSYFKPDFTRLTSIARIIYLDLPDHGRSDWGDPNAWSFAKAGDLVHGFCEVLEIDRPFVLGHSFGGLVAMEYSARHPNHPAGVILQSTFAYFDLERIVAGLRSIAGDEIADIASRSYQGDTTVTSDEWERCWQLFGPWVPSAAQRAKIPRNEAFNIVGGRLMLAVDLRPSLAAIRCPVLVSVGDLDPITPVWAAQAIFEGLTGAPATLDVVEAAGHFPWRDSPDAYWRVISDFLELVG